MARLQSCLPVFTALTLGLFACNPAYADRATPTTRSAAAIAQPTTESPYQVDLIGEDGRMLDVYQHRGRFYVLGSVGERYTIRVSNPTQRRVEAVVSVDGLDVIDGKPADLRKRGYVVPPGGELRIDGFRVSTRQVATFRFSSVASSYAGRKGKARNVGVIGVAIFEEQAAPEIVVAQPVTPRPRPFPRKDAKPRDRDFHTDARDTGSDDAPASAEAAPAPPAPARSGSTRGVGGSASSGRAPAARPATRSVSKADSAGAPMRERPTRCCDKSHTTHRPGLGTEFGERRQSAVSWTRFVRANATRPSVLAELRYNDAAGLQALGIQLAPVDDRDLELRETADPFPGGFAEPPR